jgi:hypothetical protein
MIISEKQIALNINVPIIQQYIVKIKRKCVTKKLRNCYV